MKNKLTYIGICLSLGALASAQPAWAKSDNANKQSVKQCPKEYLRDASAIRLSKKKPSAVFDDGGTDTLDDDGYYLCDKNYRNCELAAKGAAASVPGLIIIGGNAADNIEGTPGDDIICGMNGNDEIDGLEGDDRIYGDNGNDDLYGNLGDDTIYGGNGNDFISGYLDDAFDHFDPYPDDDVLIAAGDSDRDHLYGGNGKDSLLGGPDVDELYGENSNDKVDGGDGLDDVDGGKGKNNCADNDGLMNDDDCSASESGGDHGKNPRKEDD